MPGYTTASLLRITTTIIIDVHVSVGYMCVLLEHDVSRLIVLVYVLLSTQCLFVDTICVRKKNLLFFIDLPLPARHNNASLSPTHAHNK